MRPRFPEWSCTTRPQRYPIRVLPKPPASFGNIQAVKVGPLVIGDSQGSINNRYWVCYQETGNVYLRGAIDDLTWSSATLIFAEVEEIEAIDFTFDQLGREIIFYQVGTELRLWYFDSLASAFIKRVIETVAEQPICGFDLINDTSDPMSDAHLFYIKDDEILERRQRDRYDIVYPSGTEYMTMKLLSCGMSAGNKFQAEYVYRNQRNSLEKKKVYQTAGPVINNFNDDDFEVGFDIGPNFNSKCHAPDDLYFTLFEHSRSEFVIPDTTINISLIYPDPELAELPSLAVISGLLSTPLTYIDMTDHFYRGSYRFVFTTATNATKKRLQFYRNSVLESDVEFDKPTINYSATPQHNLKFGAADESVSSQPTEYWRAFKAQFLNMYCIVNGVRTDWPITAGLPAVTPSVPLGNTMTVYIDGKDGVNFG